jgi:hypothetical protein
MSRGTILTLLKRVTSVAVVVFAALPVLAQERPAQLTSEQSVTGGTGSLNLDGNDPRFPLGGVVATATSASKPAVVVRTGSSGGFEPGFVVFDSTNRELLRVASNGFVGIGTADPRSWLSVGNGTANADMTISSATGNALHIGTFMNNAAIAMNRRVSDGVFANRDLATASISFITGDRDSAIAFNTTDVNNTLDVERMRISATGKVTVHGELWAHKITGGTVVGAVYQDIAEWVETAEPIAAGTVVIVEPDANNRVIASHQAYDTRIAGVVSAQPGVILGVPADDKVMVATTGRVRVRVDASRGAIKVGDLLVSSDRPGVAMKSTPVELGGVALHRPGTLIGKALEPLADGQGEILVLLSLQ